MDYRKVNLDEYKLEVEIGIVHSKEVTKFLSKLRVQGMIAKRDYEEFLLANLIKEYSLFMKKIGKIEEVQDREKIRKKLVDYIFKFNTKLSPDHVVILGDKVMHRMDSIKSGGPSEPLLTMNPGWLGTVTSNELQVNDEPLIKMIDSIWEEVKKDSSRDYIMERIKVLGMDVPILDVQSINFSLEDFVNEYFFKKCEGNPYVAKHDKRLWIGFVIALTVPGIQYILRCLVDNRHMEKYTDNVIYTQLYLAAVKVNPELNWENIEWETMLPVQPPTTIGEQDDNVRQAESRTPLSKDGKPQRRSSRAEAEAEKPKFTDVPYEKILSLPEEIKKGIVGQDKAVEALCEQIAVARVGLRGPKRPIGAFLFTGRTGVGKTELAKVISFALTGREPIRIDCGEYQSSHEISKIFGAPPGYLGFEDDGKGPHHSTPPVTVASKLKENPFSVVLFDEIEKADPAIFNVLLPIMDEGHVTTGRGEKISFNNALIILTSNVGTAEAEEVCNANKLGFGEDDRDLCSMSEDAINEATKAKFKPEFRNRLSEIIIFNTLTKETCFGITDVLLNKTKENLEIAQHVTMSWDDSVREFVVAEGYSEEFGARPMQRVIEKQIELPLAQYILNTYYKGKGMKPLEAESIFKLSMKNGKLKFDLKEAKRRNEKINLKGGRIPSSKSAVNGKS